MQKAYQSAKVPQLVVDLISLMKVFVGDASVKSCIVSKYDSLHQLTFSIYFRVESSLHSRYIGGVPWSLQLQKFLDGIEFLSRVVKLQKRSMF